MEETNKRKRFKIGSSMILMFMLIYIPSLIHWVYGKTISTDIIRMGTIEESINADAYLVRQEDILKSPFEGKCIANADEGEKVPVGYMVATILRDSSVKLLEALKDKDQEILKAQQEKSDNQDFFSEDMAKIDDKIAEKIRLVISDSNANRLENMTEYKQSINSLIQKKASIFGGKSSSDTHINSLRNEKEKIQAQIQANTREIITSTSGIISYFIDGYEGVLTPASIKNLTPKTLEGIKPDKPSQTLNNERVEVNKPFAKVIRNTESYMVLSLDSQKAQLYGVDDSINIRINDIAKIVNGTVDYKSEPMDGKYIIKIKIDKGISETTHLRKINVDLIRSSYTGLKVPLKSLINPDFENKTAKVVISKANCAKIIDVRILGRDNDYAVIKDLKPSNDKGISLYDIFVLNPENIQEGQLINQ